MPRLGGDGRRAAGTPRGFSIATLTATNARLSILPREAGKDPRVFDIFSLRMTDLALDRPADFVASLTNPIPAGRIEAEGKVGPSVPNRRRRSRGRVPLHRRSRHHQGIAGALDSHGRFEGPLDRIAASGETTTPDFRSRSCARRPCRFDHLPRHRGRHERRRHPRSRSRCRWPTRLPRQGLDVGTKGIKGKRVVLDVTSEDARMQDVLALTVRTQPPPMTGALQLETSFDLPQGEADVIDRLELAGRVTIRQARFTSDTVQDKVDDLSRRARGRPGDEAVDDVPSDIGAAALESGVVTLGDVRYRVRGATVAMQGTYALESGALDFARHGATAGDGVADADRLQALPR